MVISAIVFLQLGAALAISLFARVGWGGTLFLRLGLGAVVLLTFTRSGTRSMYRSQLRDVIFLGAVLAGMNLFFYASLRHLPLGVTVTLEFVGPLGVAVFYSRRKQDLVWALLAAAGVLLLSDGSGHVDTLGVGLALMAGGFWGAYIVLSARIGDSELGLRALAVAMAVSAAIVAPIGIAQGGAGLLLPVNLAIGLTIGMLSSAIPYALELQALRTLPHAVFGVLMSAEPVIAALVGAATLSQGVNLTQAIAIGLVVAASAGTLRSATMPAPRDA